MNNSPYNAKFFNGMTKAEKSARVIVPLLLSYYPTDSVVDLGCATGRWLNVFKEYGCEIKGYDGEYVLDKSIEMIMPKEFFEPKDLNQPMFQENETIKRYGLAMSLEVAEHLDPIRARGFVEDLTKLSDVVLFSAAIPLQVGDHHVNCQWQTYWMELFGNQGYMAFDCFRPVIWNDERVNVIYRNNMFLYVNRNSTDPAVQKLFGTLPLLSMPSADMVHKDLFNSIVYSLLYRIKELEDRHK